MTLAETVAHAGDEVDGCDGSTDVAALQATDALLNGLIRFVQTIDVLADRSLSAAASPPPQPVLLACSGPTAIMLGW